MDYRIHRVPYIPTTRRDHELQGGSRLRDFLEPICRSREGEGFPLYRGISRSSFGIPEDTFVFAERSSPAASTFSFFVRGPLYPPLDCNRTSRKHRYKRNTIVTFILLTLYTLLHLRTSSSVNITDKSTILLWQRHLLLWLFQTCNERIVVMLLQSALYTRNL